MQKPRASHRPGLRPAFLVLLWLIGLGTAVCEELREVRFDAYSPLATNTEIVHRLMSPVDADRIQNFVRTSGKVLPEQTIELEKERFSLYLPEGPVPAAGYGLLVFVLPYDEAEVPPEWRSVLGRQGVIYAAADRSGNDHDMFGRRIPLALHAYENVSRRYRLDPTRVYVGGFSGGARTAMRLALSYPDVFRGVLLNSGSDPFGTAGISLPPKELFEQVQERSRFVFVTGERDTMVLASDVLTRHAAEGLCVQGMDIQTMEGRGHALMGARELSHALIALAKPKTTPVDRLAQCRSGLQADMAAGLAEVESLLARGEIRRAGERLSLLDDHYGGLAAPRSVELARRVIAAAAK